MSFTLLDGIKKQVPNHKEVLKEAKEKVYQWVQGEVYKLAKDKQYIKEIQDFYNRVPDLVANKNFEGFNCFCRSIWGNSFHYSQQLGVQHDLELPDEITNELKLIYLLEGDWAWHFDTLPHLVVHDDNGELLLDIEFSWLNTIDGEKITIYQLNLNRGINEQITR